jgi:transaldolase
MAHDAARSVEYGRRYYAVCPEKFIVKVPMTAAGFLAAKRLAEDGIPVNYTLGFSARQNVLAADFSRTAFVNVFMGRLNQFVSKSGLGDGKNVGEKATMATQMALRDGRENRGWSSLLIGASLRTGQQIAHLAGLDVFTMPPAAAEEFITTYDEAPTPLHSRLGVDFPVEAEPMSALSVLWEIPDAVYRFGNKLAGQDTSAWVGEDLATFARDHGCGFLFYPWSGEQLASIKADGKIPDWNRWKDDLVSGIVALDDLFSVSALQSFVTDQEELDARIERLLRESGVLS